MDADADTFRVWLDRIHVKGAVPAGMNPYTVMGLVPLYRNTAQDHDEPVLVDHPCPTCGVRRLQDGRHRFVASVMAGRADILAALAPDADERVIEDDP